MIFTLSHSKVIKTYLGLSPKGNKTIFHCRIYGQKITNSQLWSARCDGLNWQYSEFRMWKNRHFSKEHCGLVTFCAYQTFGCFFSLRSFLYLFELLGRFLGKGGTRFMPFNFYLLVRIYCVLPCILVLLWEWQRTLKPRRNVTWIFTPVGTVHLVGRNRTLSIQIGYFSTSFQLKFFSMSSKTVKAIILSHLSFLLEMKYQLNWKVSRAMFML